MGAVEAAAGVAQKVRDGYRGLVVVKLNIDRTEGRYHARVRVRRAHKLG